MDLGMGEIVVEEEPKTILEKIGYVEQLYANEIINLENGMNLVKIFKKRKQFAERFYKLDLVQHRIVASTKDWRCLKDGVKYCKRYFYTVARNLLFFIYSVCEKSL